MENKMSVPGIVAGVGVVIGASVLSGYFLWKYVSEKEKHEVTERDLEYTRAVNELYSTNNKLLREVCIDLQGKVQTLQVKVAEPNVILPTSLDLAKLLEIKSQMAEEVAQAVLRALNEPIVITDINQMSGSVDQTDYRQTVKSMVESMDDDAATAALSS
jgi:hypothetical protein